ncbi:Rha family transcriptional regulator [Methylomonas sp. HYX-M1]|uniref:Rha family transcriptional regulator n=1 Tax=Methylomonas sp. HYX-M1 TaxID=3139307 RepID=UPI00345B554A
MNQLLMIDKAPTMSSLEIAELTGKRHDHVLADIRKIFDGAGISAPDFLGVYKNQQGRGTPCFYLPRNSAHLVVSGYSVKYRLLNFQQSERINKTRTSWNRRKQICWHLQRQR